MDQYYYTDGKERYGPFTLEQLRDRNIGLETLVWKEGMPDWVAAKNIADLQSLFQPGENFPVQEPAPYLSQFPEAPPKNWLVESVLITLFCCMPLGIVGIVNATKVDLFWKMGQKEAAMVCSRDAGRWVKVGFIVGIIAIGLYFLLAMMGVFGSMMFGG